MPSIYETAMKLKALIFIFLLIVLLGFSTKYAIDSTHDHRENPFFRINENALAWTSLAFSIVLLLGASLYMYKRYNV